MNEKSYSDSVLKLKELISRELEEIKFQKKLKKTKTAVIAGQKKRKTE